MPVATPPDVRTAPRLDSPSAAAPALPPRGAPARADAAGDVAPGFDAIYAEHFAFVWRTVRRLGVPARHVDDAVQDVFVVVYRKLDGFEGRASVRSWLFGIARRVTGDYRRRAERKENDVGALPDAGIADPHARTPLEAVAEAEAVEVLHALLASLSEEQREVFVMTELEQLSAPEIADALGVSVNTVSSRLRVARAAFEKAVARHHARVHREVP